MIIRRLTLRAPLSRVFSSILGDEFGAEAPRKNRMLNFAKPVESPTGAVGRPRTVAEMKRLQAFVSEYKTAEGKSLNEAAKSFAERDEAFNEFLKEFRRKEEPKWANVFDFTAGSRQNLLLHKTQGQRADELAMLEEFKRRKQIKAYYEAVQRGERAADRYRETEQSGAEVEAEDSEKERYLKLMREYESKRGLKYFAPEEGEIFDPSQFALMFMDSDSITQITALNRINRRRVLLFAGNYDGVISYGKGRGVDYEAAFEDAVRSLKKNMIAIDLDHLNTLPRAIRGRYHDFKLEVRPRNPPNHWGGGQLWVMFKMTGIWHHDWSCVVRKRKPYNLIYAFFNLVTQNTTVRHLAEMQGKKHHQLYYARPSKYNVPIGLRT